MKKVITLFTMISIFIVAGSLVHAKTNYTVNRIDGATRYETSMNITNNYNSDKLESVIIASGDDFPDALVGCMLSKNVDAPILLISKDNSSNEGTINFIKSKLKIDGSIYILGGEASVSAKFENYLNSIGYDNIKRLGGIDRFDTNRIIVNFLNIKKNTPVVIVNGFGFSDALSVSSIAASKGYPIIMSDSSKLSEQAREMLKDIEPSKAFIIGGEGSINNNVFNQLKEVVTSLNDNNIIRIAGMNRYETSLDVCRYFNLSSDTAVIASGENFPDALSGSALAAKKNAPIILTDGVNISSQKQYLDQCNYSKLILLGGTGSISNDVEYTLENKVVISDDSIKNLLFTGDEAFKNMLKINVDGSSYINISGISYAKITEDFSKYSSIYEYLNKNYGLNNYYTDDFIKYMVSFVFTNVNGKCYMRYGNLEPRLIVQDSQIAYKKYDGNKVYVSLKGYYFGKQDVSYSNAILSFKGNKWLIDKFDNWGVE
ncbi:cell wall-binding repeat-containing protein [Clostridium sp. JS66]|uniref:cell wall-binding repeat-containing protein n=1 Tax=Clostridium sp. JS66 TaxID=3064705 RepID=UPI00399A9159